MSKLLKKKLLKCMQYFNYLFINIIYLFKNLKKLKPKITLKFLENKVIAVNSFSMH